MPACFHVVECLRACVHVCIVGCMHACMERISPRKPIIYLLTLCVCLRALIMHFNNFEFQDGSDMSRVTDVDSESGTSGSFTDSGRGQSLQGDYSNMGFVHGLQGYQEGRTHNNHPPILRSISKSPTKHICIVHVMFVYNVQLFERP